MATIPVPTSATSRPVTAERPNRRRRRGYLTAYAYILPAGLVMAAMTLFPLVYQFWMSLTNYSNRNLRTTSLLGQMVGTFDPAQSQAFNSPSFVGLQNYLWIVSGELSEVLSEFDFWRTLAFNLIWTVTNLFFHVSIGVAVAVLLNLKGLKFKRFYRAVYILPWAIPGLVAAMIWRNLFDDQSGAVNMLLGNFGIHDVRWWQQIDPPVPWLPILPLAYYAALIANVWLGWPFMMTIASGALQGIPKELYESAAVDGATPWRSFWAITAPLLRPAMVPAVLIGMMWTFNQFNVIYFTSAGGPVHRTEILVTQAYRLVNETTINLPGTGNVRAYGVAAAFSYIVFLVLGALTLLTNRVSRATEAYYE